MRNLKKILALVLALVMSLSLMATASAGTFEDVPDDSSYKAATDVLNGLKVFKGYQDGSFQPDKTITRAEVATIIYRIATADVDDTQNAIYTSWKKFSDVKDTDWYAGYVNYCANAEYVKGNTDGTFAPQSNVTGYAVLAMILRAMGWDRNHEFEGKDWQIQTAAIARQEGLLDGVTNASEAQLGQPAPRGMVAQILFNALLTEMVEYTVLGGYQHNGKTLGQQQFGLEQVQGVVMANEWANLKENGTKVLAAGKTEMKISKVQDAGATVEVGKNYTLDYTTDLDAVGLNHVAYIANKTGEKQVLAMEAVGNTVAYNEGAAVGTGKSDQSKASIAALAAGEGIDLSDKQTEYFVDYDESWDDVATSDHLIRYAVAKFLVDGGNNPVTNTTVAKNVNWYDFLNSTAIKGTVTERTITATVRLPDGTTREVTVPCYVRTIQPEKTIEVVDQEIMRSIFYTADRLVESNTSSYILDYVYGEVYVGTSSVKDISDTLSWKQFKLDYFNEMKYARKFASAENGESLRVIDNNGDGVAEYVLKIQYTQAKAVDTISDALLFSSGLLMSKYTGNNLDAQDELARGDIANYRVIDGKLSIWKANVVTDTITAKSFEKITVTPESGEAKGQSGIFNRTSLSDNILQMDDKVLYNMYLDQYGYIRTYELANGPQYALLTEMYSGTIQNYNYLTNTRWIVEMKAGDTDIVERYVANKTGNQYDGSVFATPDYAWTSRTSTLNAGYISYTGGLNYLQPATAHLGITGATAVVSGVKRGVQGTAIGGITPEYRNTAWGRNVFEVGTAAMFDYGPVVYTTKADGTPAPVAPAARTADNSFSFTNVATYVMEDEEVRLNSASKLATNPNGEYLYRSTTVLANGKPAGTVLSQAGWEAAYRATSSSITASMATNWFTTCFQNGDLYRVYATDYVQLKTTESYAAGTRHFAIASDYESKYNTLSNDYVDATVNTEFYIVTPSVIHYVVGYDALLDIAAADVRAAYAVAQNTATDVDGEDYWVADVIVIEVNELDYDYDSISLMYYNPSETLNEVRNVRSLNNSWRKLQPDSALRAKVEVIPAYSRNTVIVTWGNTPWTVGNTVTGAGSDYGFYFLYNTESAGEGSLNAASIAKLTSNFNKYGIYAGVVKRITEVLDSSGYIDVELQDGTAKHVTVRGSDYNTPVYRIKTDAGVTSAAEINLINDYNLPIADVKVGDNVIVVYDNSGRGQAAYLVDVAQRDDDKNGTDDWTVPAWLKLLWTNIYNDLPTSTGYTITFKRMLTTDNTTVDASNTVVGAPVEFKVAKGGTQTVYQAGLPSASGIKVPGYELKAILDANGNAISGDANLASKLVSGTTIAGGDAIWTLNNVQANATYTAIYAATGLAIQLDFSGAQGNAANAPLVGVTAVPADDTAATSSVSYTSSDYLNLSGTTLTSNSTSTNTVPAGTTYRFALSRLDRNANTYTLTLNGADVTATMLKWTSASTATIEAVAWDDVALVLTADGLPTTKVDFNAYSDATLTTTTKASDGTALDVAISGSSRVLNNTKINFTVTPATGYAISKVSYQIGSGVTSQTGTLTALTGTSKTASLYELDLAAIPAALKGLDVLFTVETVDTTDITTTFSNTSGGTISYKTADMATYTNWTSGNFDVDPLDGTVTLQTSVVAKVTANNSAVVTNPSGDMKNWVISGISTSTTTITVAGPDDVGNTIPVACSTSGVVTWTKPTTAGSTFKYYLDDSPSATTMTTATTGLLVGSAPSQVKTKMDTALTASITLKDVPTGDWILTQAEGNGNYLVILEFNQYGLLIAAGETTSTISIT